MRLNHFFMCIVLLSVAIFLFGCGKESKMLQSAENYFQQGNYQQANQLCQQIVNGNPKPEVFTRAKTLLLESSAGMGYAEVIEQLKQDKIAALSKLEELKLKFSATSFIGKFDSVYNFTKSFLLENDPAYIFKSAKLLSADKNYDEAINLLAIINSKFSNTEWKLKSQSELASVKSLKAENDKAMAEQQEKQEKEYAQKSGKGKYAGLKFGMSETQVIEGFRQNGIYQSVSKNEGQGIMIINFNGTLETMRGALFTSCFFCDDQLFEIHILWPKKEISDDCKASFHAIQDILEEKYGSPDIKEEVSFHDYISKWKGSDGFSIALDIETPKSDDHTLKLYFSNSKLDKCSSRKDSGGF